MDQTQIHRHPLQTTLDLRTIRNRHPLQQHHHDLKHPDTIGRYQLSSASEEEVQVAAVQGIIVEIKDHLDVVLMVGETPCRLAKILIKWRVDLFCCFFHRNKVVGPD